MNVQRKRPYFLLILLFLFSLPATEAINISRYRFNTIPAAHYYHGILEITKDSIGRIWYNGRDALFMYDGNSFNQMNSYVQELLPASSISFQQVWTDRENRLFVTTNKGLLHFDYSSFKFRYIVKGGYINSIAQDDDGYIWILRDNKIESFLFDGKYHLKEYRMDSPTGYSALNYIDGNCYFAQNHNIYRINRKMEKPELFMSLDRSVSMIKQIIGYKSDFFILTDPNGLYRVDKNGRIIKKYNLSFLPGTSGDSKKLYIDPSGVLWIATQHGLALIDTETEEQILLKSDPKSKYSIPHNSIWSIYPDPDGGVWIGTFGGKLAYLNFDDNQVDYITQITGRLNSAIVSCFEEDKNGNIWIGTEGGGVNLWNRRNDTFTYFTDKNGLNYNLIKSLKFDEEKQNLKISAYNGGIVNYNINSNKFTDAQIHRLYNPSIQLSVYDFELDADSGIWIANPDEALYYKNLSTKTIQNIPIVDINGNRLNNISIECLYKEDKNLWLFSHLGIYIMDIQSKKIVTQFQIEDTPYFANNLICFLKTSESEIWVGTMGGGLNILTPDGTYKNINEKDGFIPKTVFGILEDRVTKNIWMSTDEGIYFYDRNTKTFQKADIADPNIYGSFYPKSCFITSRGEMLFGGTKGFILFKPDKDHFNHQKPRVFFTDLFINNNKIEAGNPILESDISVMGMSGNNQVIELSYNESNIRIDFSSNSYLLPDKNKFVYRLKGSSAEWQAIPAGQQFVQFFNLTPGSYTFQIRGANNDGVWGDQISSLDFHIAGPPWFSTWAYLLYISLILGFVYVIWKYFTDKKIFKHKLKLERLKEQKMSELIQMRIDFFTNISHDLKTPLTLIVDPLIRLKNTLNTGDPAMDYVLLIERSVTKIQRMISQLLQFREIESRKITLNPRPGDFVKYTSDIFDLFIPYANKKNIRTSFESYQEHVYVDFDYDIVEKILFNLISNAIKYSPDGESVYVKIAENKGKNRSSSSEKKTSPIKQICIEVVNTGTEISKEDEDILFKSFSRISDKKPVFESSTGLGLAIVKQLVETLDGLVSLKSENNSVSFNVVLSFRISDKNAQIAESFMYDYTITELSNMDLEPESEEKTGKTQRKAYDVVFIEDDAPLRKYIEKELSKHFNVYVAADGTEGVVLAKKVSPHIVITDFMMPGMNGFDVCKELRSDIQTSHTPIIIVSALGDNSSYKIQGLKDGADIVIEKPFDVDFLVEQANNLIKNRNLLKEKYSTKIVAEPSRITFSSIDEELLKKAITHIESNIDNPEYDVDAFVSDMAISRTLLYRKINDITGMSIKEFILDMRLKRSAQLLEDSQLTISEIAVRTGFNDSKYFSVCFKRHYGVSPSQFKKKSE